MSSSNEKASSAGVATASGTGLMPEAKILIVDDSEIVLEVIRRTLEEAGFAAATIASAFQLTQAIREESPDLILLDVNMPALRGDKAALILKKHSFSREIPVLLHSELEAAQLAEIVAETEATGYIRKTGDGDRLVAHIRHWLARVRRPEVSAPDVPLPEEAESAAPNPPVAEATPIAKVLDPSLLGHLRDMRVRWGYETLESLEEMFLDQRSRLKDLERATTAGDATSVVEIAHFLKGTARTLGAKRLAELLARVEMRGRANDLADPEILLADLANEWRRTAAAFRVLAAEVETARF